MMQSAVTSPRSESLAVVHHHRAMIFLLSLLLLAAQSHGKEDVCIFLETPDDTVSPILSYATFSCSIPAAQDGDLLWEVDDVQTSLESYAAALRAKGMNWSTTTTDGARTRLELTVLASKENNETEIVCVAITGAAEHIQTHETQPANLYVYDRPSPPVILSLDPIVAGQIAVSWSQPYSHPSVSISYNLSIALSDYSSHGGFSMSVLVENTTSYVFHPSLATCDKYTFSVQAGNLAGFSGKSNLMSATVPSAPNTSLLSSSLSHTLTIAENGSMMCTISFLPAQACYDYPVLRYTVHLLNILTNTTLLYDLLPTPSPNVYLNTTHGLDRDSHYVYYILVEGGAGMKESGRRDLVTTDVSNVTHYLDWPTLSITCHFLPGSTAKGCLVVLSPEDESSLECKQLSQNIRRSNLSDQASGVLQLSKEICCTGYTLSIYDWEEDGSYSDIVLPLYQDSRLCDNPEIKTGDVAIPSSPSSPDSWRKIVPIIASALGGAILVSGMLILVLLGAYCHHKRRIVNPANKSSDGPAPSLASQQSINLGFNDLPDNSPPPPPPLYDHPDSLLYSTSLEGSAHYSILTRDSGQLLTRTSSPEPLYSTLNHYEQLDVVNPLKNNINTLPPLPQNSYTQNNHTLLSGREHEFINSMPSAGTSV